MKESDFIEDGIDSEIPSVKELLQYLNSSEDFMRWRAAKALGIMNIKEAIPNLIKKLETDKSWGVRMNAAEALGMLEAKEAIPVLIEALLKDEDEQVREISANALGNFNEKSIKKALKEALNDECEDVKLAAKKILESYDGSD
ncbi:MAG: HEAT repeat domain-containing protein [Candidatus Coatesbacteria bacterium]|nr:HEAT repeat domain-containing protein [Candidatus Coatesbacteria bacterium]